MQDRDVEEMGEEQVRVGNRCELPQATAKLLKLIMLTTTPGVTVGVDTWIPRCMVVAAIKDWGEAKINQAARLPIGEGY